MGGMEVGGSGGGVMGRLAVGDRIGEAGLRLSSGCYRARTPSARSLAAKGRRRHFLDLPNH